MNYIEYMQQPAGPITPALQLFNIPNQSVPEEVRQRLGMNSLAYKQTQDKTAKQILKDGGSFLKHFPLKEIYRYRRLTPDNYQAPKIFKS